MVKYMTKDKFLVQVINVYLAPLTVMYFVHENYFQEDCSKCFRIIKESYQEYMKLYDIMREHVAGKSTMSEETVDSMLLYRLNNDHSESVRNFLEFLNRKVIQKYSIPYNVYDKYQEYVSQVGELYAFIEMLNDLRKIEESRS